MNKERVYYTKPSITELEVTYATDAARNGWGEHCYEYIYRFEQLFAQHLNVNHAIATSSCTGAMHMGLSALSIGLDDEVILADTNWIATAAPITYLGAKPIFVDILPDSWCIDPIQAEKAITSKTKAIIATHLYGNLCDMEALLAIGKKYNLPIIEDSAEAIGSVYHNKKVGSIGTFGIFSFHGTKTLTTGEGGMFVTNNSELYETVLTLSNHGRSRNQTKQFWADMIGFKYKISNIQAALGCAQLERIDELIASKRLIFERYQQHLATLPIYLNPEYKGTINGYWMPTAVFEKDTGITRENLQKAFGEENIDARVFFWPLSSLPAFANYKSRYNSISHDICTRSINLPSYYGLTKQAQLRIIAVIENILRHDR
jgi:perosamine synthetase